jgi:hypothetical protein
MTVSVEQLATEIAALKKRVRTLSRKPQLTHSAIDDGALVATSDGQLTTIIGEQYDGTSGAVVVTGPPPPVPAAPTMEQVLGGVAVTVTGEWEQNPTFDRPIVAPLDFARFEVEVCDDPSFAAKITRAGVTSASGGTVVVAWAPVGTPLYARVRARTLPGKVSLPSLSAGPVESGPVGLTDLGFDIAEYAGGTTISYGTAAPVDPDIGDLWLKEVGTSTGAPGQPPAGTVLYETRRWDGFAWKLTEAQGITAALQQAIAANQLADSKAKVFQQTSAPVAQPGPTGSAIWYDTDNGNRLHVWNAETQSWTIRTLGNGSITPQSLVASNVIATGTITASLLEALLVLATTIVAGNPNGDHARMTASGFRVYKADELGGPPDEVVRMGTDTNDYFGVVDANGNLVASVDDTGRASFSAVDTGSLSVGGRTLSDILAERGMGGVGYFQGFAPGQPNMGGNYGPIRDRVGVAEVNGYMYAGRRYRISARYTWAAYDYPSTDSTEHRVQFTVTRPSAPNSNTAATPMVNSEQIDQTVFPAIWPAAWTGAYFETAFTPQVTGRHRFLMSMERGAGNAGANVFIIGEKVVILKIEDLGISTQNAGALSQGGGTFYLGPPPPPPPPPTQSYYVDLAPVGRATWRGDGAFRAGSDVYQGYEGTTGDNAGQFWFDLPPITGTVDRVDVYLYFRHWWFNSGGTVIMNISDQRGSNGRSFFKFKGDWHTSGWPKPGSRTVTVPSDWWPLFKGTTNTNYNGRATAITLGPGGGTNQTYYGVATDARLRIWYTQ